MIGFHRFLIGTAILFCALFAVWTFVAYRAAGRGGELALAIAFAIAAVALAYYLRHLNRFLHHDDTRRDER